MAEFREGCFFSMPDSEYRAIEALSASGMKHLRQSPLDYWARSSWNPRQAEALAEDSSDAKDLGSAFDARIIEGAEVFNARYAERPVPVKEDGWLVTCDHMKARLKELGEKVGGSKDELIARLRAADPEAKIWDDFEATYYKAHEGKEFLDSEWMDKIEYAARMIEADPIFGKAFSGGAPQVSVFWTCPTIGVPCKARFDYLKARAIVDLKTVQPMRGTPHADTIRIAIGRYRYHVQATLYMEAAAEVSQFLKSGKSDGFYEVDLGQKLLADAPKTWLWVFQVKGPAPAVIGRTLSPQSMICQAARAEIDTMKQLYRLCREKWGTDPWLYDPQNPPKIEMLQDGDLPPWALT